MSSGGIPMKKSLMKKQNWILVILGVLITYFGFFLFSFITTNYDGVYAFLCGIVTFAGVITVAAGLAIGFESKNEQQ
jgi:uncharacterized membrane protein HdeD (DUF308 family)